RPRQKRRVAQRDVRIARPRCPQQRQDRRQYDIGPVLRITEQALAEERERELSEGGLAEIDPRQRGLVTEQRVLQRQGTEAVAERQQREGDLPPLLAPGDAAITVERDQQEQKREQVKPRILARHQADREEDRGEP